MGMCPIFQKECKEIKECEWRIKIPEYVDEEGHVHEATTTCAITDIANSLSCLPDLTEAIGVALQHFNNLLQYAQTILPQMQAQKKE